MKYLRKRKVYGLAVEMLSSYEIPSCIDCLYKFHSGYEWLTFSTDEGFVRFTVAYGGKWMRVFEQNGDDIVVDKVLKRI